MPAFAVFLGKNYEVQYAKAGHIRRFGNTSALKFYVWGVKYIVVLFIQYLLGDLRALCGESSHHRRA